MREILGGGELCEGAGRLCQGLVRLSEQHLLDRRISTSGNRCLNLRGSYPPWGRTSGNQQPEPLLRIGPLRLSPAWLQALKEETLG